MTQTQHRGMLQPDGQSNIGQNMKYMKVKTTIGMEIVTTRELNGQPKKTTISASASASASSSSRNLVRKILLRCIPPPNL